ncbi:MAG: hypothetical protein IJW41_00060 [Oscillospiraceae bacterium]|nr:hypothetical protein [Oscillospiraceae bacterium]
MKLPYRTRQRLIRIGVILLVIAFVALLIAVLWLLWAKRYVIYTRDGAKLDFDLPETLPQGQEAEPPKEENLPPLYFVTEEDALVNSTELMQMKGYYADTEALKDIPAVKTQIQALEAGTAVMLDVKSIYGNYFYSSEVGTTRSSAIDIEAMDSLIAYLKNSKYYLIARLPALRDREYGLHHTIDGIAVKSGAYLWVDDEGCYWLNPSSQGTVSHLVQIATELKNLGFDEVVFEDYCFPNTDNMAFSGDKAKALSSAAQTLVTTCATERFTVSFVSTGHFTPPTGRTRIYWEGAEAYKAADIAAASGVADPTINLVFLTEVHDTRFDAFSVLRPLEAAH